MESRSSESNYGFDEYISESHDDYYSSLSSESKLESWYSSSTESRDMDIQMPVTEQKIQYNSLDDIDELIERLETCLQNTKVTSERVNKILAQRKQKIEALKQLVAEARRTFAEEKIIKRLEQENDELDDAIDSIKRRLYNNGKHI